jgi:hypothetical protein
VRAAAVTAAAAAAAAVAVAAVRCTYVCTVSCSFRLWEERIWFEVLKLLEQVDHPNIVNGQISTSSDTFQLVHIVWVVGGVVLWARHLDERR